jgi:hypothetical protein
MTPSTGCFFQILIKYQCRQRTEGFVDDEFGLFTFSCTLAFALFVKKKTCM